jgi:AbrB family looped-hinge helix DNA binding protein
MPAPLVGGILSGSRDQGQVTIPRSVREALGLDEGGHVVFRVEGRRAARFGREP